MPAAEGVCRPRGAPAGGGAGSAEQRKCAPVAAQGGPLGPLRIARCDEKAKVTVIKTSPKHPFGLVFVFFVNDIINLFQVYIILPGLLYLHIY